MFLRCLKRQVLDRKEKAGCISFGSESARNGEGKATDRGRLHGIWLGLCLFQLLWVVLVFMIFCYFKKTYDLASNLSAYTSALDSANHVSLRLYSETESCT